MGLKLRKRTLPMVQFRRELPWFLRSLNDGEVEETREQWLERDGETPFIEIDARPAGPINPAFVQGAEELIIRGKAMDRKVSKIEDDDEAVNAQWESVRAIIRGRLENLHDTCVIEWRSNIIDGESQIRCNRKSFLDLAQAGEPSIDSAVRDFEKACLEAGKELLKVDEELEKNSPRRSAGA